MRSLFVVMMVFAGCAGRLPQSSVVPLAGWVDFARVTTESALGKRLTNDHALLVKKKHEEIDEVAKLLEAAEKRAQERAEAAVKKPGSHVATEDIEYQRHYADARVSQLRTEIQMDDARKAAALRDAIRPVAARVAQEHHLTTVDLIPEDRLYAAPDLTNEVIRKLDVEIGQTK